MHYSFSISSHLFAAGFVVLIIDKIYNKNKETINVCLAAKAFIHTIGTSGRKNKFLLLHPLVSWLVGALVPSSRPVA